MQSNLFEVIQYIGPESPEELKSRQREMNHLIKSLEFVFRTHADIYSLGDGDCSIEDPLARFYLINSHGTLEQGKHFFVTENGLKPTLEVILKDLNDRNPERDAPTILMIDSCYSGAIIKDPPSDLSILTSDGDNETSYTSANIFGNLAEPLVQLPFIQDQVSTDDFYKILTQSRIDALQLMELKEKFGLLRKSELLLGYHPNTTGHNKVNISLPLPKRSPIELFDELYDYHTHEVLAAGFSPVPFDIPDQLKERYVKLLRSRANELTFEHLNPGSTSYKLLKNGAFDFGHPFCERILNTLEDTPTDKWKDIWHHFFDKYGAEEDENHI